jgi:murein DD-endopeptidase MepM/ murein hydrolase activator NlpD
MREQHVDVSETTSDRRRRVSAPSPARRFTRLIGSVLAIAAAVGSQTSCGSGRPGRDVGQVPAGRPVVGDGVVVTSAFGSRRGRSVHQGIDFSAPKGASVRATAGGVVAFAGRSGAFGRMVVVDHGGGWRTRYAHLKKITVRANAEVRKGTVIGKVGKSGNATGYHLHYEVHHHDRAIDPATTF